MVTEDKEKGWREIVANVERLIADAKLLQAHKRCASAMSTAILAFEESGKGSDYETSFGISRKGKNNAYSWHMLRQIVAAFFLNASLLQKYGIKPNVSPEVAEAIKNRWDEFSSIKEGATAPIPQKIQDAVRVDLQNDRENMEIINRLSEEDIFIYRAEQRWCKKLIVSAMSGRTEALRQRGMYVDLDGNTIKSTPMAVDGITSQYWINAADRAVLILRDGDYFAPYGTLAAYLESLERPFDPMEAAADVDGHIRYLSQKGHK